MTSIQAGPMIGRAMPRREDERFISGAGSYTDDRHFDGQLHAVFLRSRVAHGKITRLSTETAARLPGVRAILTGADYAADGLEPVDHLPNPADIIDIRKRALIDADGKDVQGRPHWPLPQHEISHLGEPIAIVIADSVAAALDAVERIELEIAELPAVLDINSAVIAGGEEHLFFDICSGDAADGDKIFRDAAHVVTHSFATQRIVNCQMEPRAAIGLYENGNYTLVSGNQGVSRLQMQLAQALVTPADRLRIITPDTGGGFGPRTYLQPEQICILWAARKTGCPVRWTSTRHEAFLSDYQGRDSLATMTLALDAEGRFLAYRADFSSNVGAYSVAYVTAANAMKMFPTCYRIPHLDVRLRGVRTHTVPTAPYRGAGRPEANHLIERMIDIAAIRLDMNRIKLRQLNIIRPRDLPYISAAGQPYDAVDFPLYMTRALELADWKGFSRRRAQSERTGKLRGIGLANHMEAPVGAPVERLKIHIHDHSLELVVGTQSTGQGHETTYAQIASDLLGVPFDKITVTMGDSAVVSMGGGTHSDRSLRYVSTLAKSAADKLIAAGIKSAATPLQTSPDDITFANGVFRSASKGSEITLLELARHAKGVGDIEFPATVSEDFIGRITVFPGGSAVCEVEIDPSTGETSVVNYCAVDDVGQIVNPMIVAGQAHGGIVQGLGQVAREGVTFTDGQMMTATFMDYAITRAADAVFFKLDHVEAPVRNNPYRIKGGGEGGNTPVTAAYLNAVCDALGAKCSDLDMPVTAQSIWKFLQSNRRE